jgi:serine kinase of HPr protein (carbohydrate metabolism regulator)
VETRLTLRPGQPGTRKLVERYGERLVRVRYVYDAAAGRRLKTVELVVQSVPWKPCARKRRRQDDDVVYVRIAYHETDLRERAKRLGETIYP